MFRLCVLLFCFTFVHGTDWLPDPRMIGVNGIIPFSIFPDARLDFSGSPLGAGEQFDGVWSQYGALNMYMNQAGMKGFYQDYPPFMNDVVYPYLYQQQGPFAIEYLGGFHNGYMQTPMNFYPVGHYHFGYCRITRNFPGMVPFYPQMTTKIPQPLPSVPTKTVQPVQPVQHLKLPPVSVESKKPVQKLPFQIPKAKTPWDGKSTTEHNNHFTCTDR